MKWILMAALLATGQAHATLIQYTFDVAAREVSSPLGPNDKADMKVLVDTTTRAITRLTYTNTYFDIDYVGSASIEAAFWGPNEDGSGYYAITSVLWSILPDGGSMLMYLEASMPISSNPSEYLDKGYDGQMFYFYNALGDVTHTGFWSHTTKVVVSEPATLSMLGLGLALLGLRRWFAR